MVNSTAYDPGQWSGYFTAAVTVAGTLLGLLFVVLTLDREQLISHPVRSAWARECFGGLIALLAIGFSGLIPQESTEGFGIVLIALGVALVSSGMALQIRTIRRLHPDRRRSWGLRVAILNLAAVTTSLSGATLIARTGGGLYWLVATTVIYLAWALTNAWRLVIPSRPPATDESGGLF